MQSDQQIVGGLEVGFPARLAVVFGLLADVNLVTASTNGAMHDRHKLTAHLPVLLI